MVSARRGPRPAKPAKASKQATNLQRAFAQAVQEMRARRFAEADALCRHILKADMLHKDAMHLRGIIAFQAGDGDLAIKRMLDLAALSPKDAMVWNDLGMFHHALGRHQAAAGYLHKALALDPKLAGAHLNLGNVQNACGDLRKAEASYKRALKYQPALAGALNNLIDIQLKLAAPEAAENTARDFVRMAPNLARSHVQLAKALDHLGRHRDAAAAFEQALKLNPDDVRVWMDYAASLANEGQIDAAIAACRKVIGLKPDYVPAYGKLALLAKPGPDAAELERMRQLLANPALSAADQTTLHFALGKVLEDARDFGPAFEHILAANKLKRAQLIYDPVATEKLFADIKSTFSAELIASFAGAGLDEATPIFVLGLPRSGTSLVEQILSSHPEVAGAGELPELRNQIDALCDDLGSPDFARLMRKVTPLQLQAMGQRYLARLRTFSAEARHIVDKVPANFMFAGLIRIVFPKAIIVHCRRNLLDTSLSMFKTHFGDGAVLHSYDMAELGRYCRLYQDLMAHWHQVMPGVIYDIDYEKLVADQEGETRKLLAACGLDWSDACLDFFNTSRPVRTASIAQVRQPIYNKSVGIAERYGAALEPLLKALQD